jgi:hypothetical protein
MPAEMRALFAALPPLLKQFTGARIARRAT